VINPREFCREPGYASALLLTYTFDPMFFERILFSDLSYGGAEKIIVIADSSEVEKAMERSAGQLRQIGRRYLLIPAKVDHAFHPKLIARFGQDDGMVWIGSGNLTAGGWGGNLELGASWKVGPKEEDQGIWLTELLGQAIDWAFEGFQKRELQDLIDYPWLNRNSYNNSASDAPVLLGSHANSLADKLASRWSGRRFTDLRLMTGSTDEDGRFLEWVHQIFGVENVTIYMTPANAIYDIKKLNNLPINISFLPAPSDAMLHAKFYWFSGDEGEAAVLGSSNASRSAWQLIDGNQGNVELIVPHDHPSPEEFSEILAKFKGGDLRSPAEILGEDKSDRTPDEKSDAYRLDNLEVSYAMGSISARIEPALGDVAEVILVFRPGDVSADLHRVGDVWHGQLPENAPGLGTAMFASARIFVAEEEHVTPVRWVDCPDEIRQSGRARGVGSVINDLGDRGSSNKEQTQVLRAIQIAADYIMQIKEEDFVEPVSGSRQGKREIVKKGSTKEVGSVDPELLLRSIAETGSHGSAQRNLNPVQIGQLSFGGIMRSLFDFQSQESSNDEARVNLEPETIDQAAYNNATNLEPNQPGEINNRNISEQGRIKLSQHLDEFIKRLATSEFAEVCSPRQLLEASLFPVAVSVNAAQGGWFGSARVGQVVMKICSILFEKQYRRGLPVGLLSFVLGRCESVAEVEKFNEIIGDGRLWCALIAGVCTSGSSGFYASLQKAEILSLIYSNKILLSRAVEDDIRLFLDHLRVPGAGIIVAEMAPNAVKLINRVKSYLIENWDELYREHGKGRRAYENGNFLWGRHMGWALIEGGTTYMPGYVNVEWARRDHIEISNLIDQLVASVEGSTPEMRKSDDGGSRHLERNRVN
jgi:hypothetical protein